MNAKEYFKENYPDVFNDIDDQQNPEESVAVPIAQLMEEYHQAKSKEEAERLLHFYDYIEQHTPDRIPNNIRESVVERYIKNYPLAAFGKEGEG